MKNFVTVTLAIFICLAVGVESTDSNTAVDLASLADIVCKSKKVLYYRDGYKKFCELSKKIICPRTGKTPDPESVSCKATESPRIRYQMIKVHKAVCQYEGRDETTKKVQALMQDAGQCMYY
ncbi:uncharacterized protein LOC134818909 [Bolinopsis microptera]|uniref:uncharacterized protein LOC134818909 n=1 Tax=Bolinopsis microptera TaxID=2820187 RepID=UPI0030794C28